MVPRQLDSICVARCKRTVEAVPNGDEQVLQNFLTHSSWDYRAVMDRVAQQADVCLGAEAGAGLYIDN